MGLKNYFAKSKPEIEAVTQAELEIWWKEILKILPKWADLPEDRLAKRKEGFIKSLYHTVKIKSTLFKDAKSFKEYLDRKRDDNLRTVTHKLKMYDASLHGKNPKGIQK